MFQILVVEDDKNTARLMRRFLPMRIMKFFRRQADKEALDLMDNQHVDLILLDVMMPVMDWDTSLRISFEKAAIIPPS